MPISEYCCLSRRVEQVEYYCIWDIVIEFLQIFVTVKLISLMLNPTAPNPSMRSPTLRPKMLYEDAFLRKRLMAINWKLMANKARAMYYMKISCYPRRLVTQARRLFLTLQRASEENTQELPRCRSLEK